jgi:hypothetical protein
LSSVHSSSDNSTHFSRFNSFIDQGWMEDERLGLVAVKLYLIYLRFANGDGLAWPSNRKLTELLGSYDDKRIGPARRRLAEMGFLRLVDPPRGQRSPVFQVLSPPKRGAELQGGAVLQGGTLLPEKGGALLPCAYKDEHPIEQPSSCAEEAKPPPTPAAGLASLREEIQNAGPYLTFPVSGGAGRIRTWGLFEDHLAMLRQAYPTLDVLASAKAALAWVVLNPGRRKSAGRMGDFLFKWCKRDLNEQINPPPRQPARKGPAHPSWQDRQSELRRREANAERVRGIALLKRDGRLDEARRLAILSASAITAERWESQDAENPSDPYFAEAMIRAGLKMQDAELGNR